MTRPESVRTMTVEEYLRFDESSQVRHEFVGGDVYVIITEPCAIIEVTSASTARIDRGEKLMAYRAIPSLRAYLIVDHRHRRVERHWRAEAGAEWHTNELVGDGSVLVPRLGVELTLDVINRRVDLAIAEPEVAQYEA